MVLKTTKLPKIRAEWLHILLPANTGCWVGLLILFPVFLSFGQHDDLILPEEIQKLSQKHGLSSSKITTICKDDLGFIWFGTTNGLNRYDGKSIKSYKNNPENPHSLSGDYVKCLFKDSNGQLWVGTTAGLNLFDYETHAFTKPTMQDTGSEVTISALTEDKNHHLWIASSGGVGRLSIKTGRYQTYKEIYNRPDFTNSFVTRLHCDRKGNIWLGTWTDGIYILDPQTGLTEKFSMPGQPNDITSSGRISAFAEGTDGSIWVGGWGTGLMRIFPDRKSVTVYQHDDKNKNSLNGNKIKALAFDSEGFLWIGTEESGLDRFSPAKGTFVHHFADFHGPDVYEGASIYSILIDDQLMMWLGFRNDGVRKVRLHSSPFRHYARPEEENYRVFSFAESENGLWLGVKGSLDHLNLQTQQFTRYPLPNNETPIAVYPLDRGKLLTGTYKGSIFLYDAERQTFEPYLPEHLKNFFKGKKVNSFYKASPNNLLIGSQAGFFDYNPESESLKKISPKWTHSILPAGRDSFWLLRFDEAIDRYFPGNGRRVSKKFKRIGPLKAAAVSGEHMFVGTDLGFYGYNLKNDSILRYKDVFPHQSNQVNAILRDHQHNIWFSAENDLVFFDLERQTFRAFNAMDGLPAMRFRDEAGIRLKNGNMVFGGDGGIIVVNPSAYRPKQNNANLMFSKLLIANREILAGENNSPLERDISVTDNLTLKYHQNIISFEFSLLSYINPQKHQYRYKMTGMDNEWFDLGSQNSVTFANLPPGDYQLHIQASNEDGIWGRTDSIGITVLPPFWQTWYAYAFYFLCLVAISYLIRKVNLNKEKLKNKIALEQMKQENIRNLARRESEFHDMRLRFFTNISHEFRTPLTLILGPLERFMQKNEHPTGAHLKLMYKNAERLKRLITQILDFRKMEAGDLKFEATWGDIVRFSLETAHLFIPLAQQKAIEFQTHCNESSKYAWFDRDKLEKIIFNLLSNAFKYTAEGSVTFTVNIFEKTPQTSGTGKTPRLQNKLKGSADYFMEITVADTGIGIPEKEQRNIFDRFYHVRPEKSDQSSGTGIGLTLTKELVEVHKGSITVRSKVKEGTEFRVVVPLLTEEKWQDPKTHTPAPDDTAGLLGSARSEALLLPENEEMESMAPARPVVMLVENNKDLREYLRLEFAGSYTLLEAEHGKEGLEKALEHIPDLIISDVMMPEMDGIEFCHLIKTNKLTSHIPVILLTAHSSQIHIKEGLETGADDFITKPFSSDLLITRIGNLLKIRKELQSKFSQELKLAPEGLPVRGMDEDFLKKAMEVVEGNLNNADFSADLFASEMCMSRVHLYRKLKALTDLSITDFVKNARLQLASDLIRANKLTVKETAYTVGFKDPKYFSKCFKEQFGVRPSEYCGN